MYRHILVPTDGTALSLKAAKAAAALAAPLKARITALHVIRPFFPLTAIDAPMFNTATMRREYDVAVHKAADKALAKVAAVAGKARVQVLTVSHEQPWRAIVDTARKKKCDLIVMASHGRGGLAGLLLGSEAQKVLTHSKTPVLVCR